MNSSNTIICPSCSNPIKTLGGGRVKIANCKSCGNTINLDDNRIIYNFEKARNPATIPFTIGSSGKINHIEYTIIGRVDYSIIDSTDYESWSELLLFNKKYGYAWLVVSNNYLEFSKRYRKLPLLTWDDANNLNYLEVKNSKYEFDSNYLARVTYIEGELNYIARIGDRFEFIEFSSSRYNISLEKSKNEIEAYWSQPLEKEKIYNAFNISSNTKQYEANNYIFKNTIIDDKEDKSSKDAKPFEKLLFSIILFLLFSVAYFKVESPNHQIVSTFANTKEYNLNFNVEEEKHLVEITLKYDKSYNLTNSKLNIYNSNSNSPLFTLSDRVGKYSNGEKIGKIHFGATEAKIYLNLKKGSYRLNLPSNTNNQNPYINIVEGVARYDYLIFMIIIPLILFFLSVVISFINRILRY